MGVNVDEAGGDERTVSLDHPGGGRGDLAEFDDHPAAYPNIGCEGRTSRPIHHRRALDEDIKHCHLSLGLLKQDCMPDSRG
ncbi:hypothetical protein GCM10009076_20150 [Erythrobacter ramosus]